MGVTGVGSSLNLKGDWNELKGKLKQQYAQLTDEDLDYTEGKGDELVGRLQGKLGKGKREITKMLNDL
nr:CsbD family protein [Hymenobacter aquaticus]